MYDKESIYDEKISPLMTQIIDICKENGIAFIADFLLKDEEADEQGDFHCTTYINEIKNEKLQDLYNVVYKGYVVQKPFFMAMTITSDKEG